MSKEIKKLETEIVRLRAWVQELEEIGREQDRTISSDKTLIKSLKTTLEALRADAKASQDLHGKNLHEMAHYQICLERRDAELAEANNRVAWLKASEAVRQDRPDSEMTDSYNEQTNQEITDIILDPGRRLDKQEEYIKLIIGYLLTLRGEKFSPSIIRISIAEAMDELLGGTK
jgi:uncharacterized coiled-coil protein SlyX